MAMTDIMVDIETSGTNPQFGAIFQIAGVTFNYETGEIGPHFDRCLAMAPNRFWSDGTRDFWSRQAASTFNDIVNRMEDPELVLRDFSLFAAQGGPLRFWSKPLSFDYPFISSYFEQYGLAMPFQYRTARDLNTFIAALRGTADHVNMKHIEEQHTGTLHNALSDCVLQLKMLFAAKAGHWHEVIPA